MGFIDFTNGEVLTADQMDTVMRQSVMKFADASARDTALSAVLAEGMMAYLEDTDEVLKYDGSSWIDISGDITGITAGTALTGGGTSGNVTLDVDETALTIAQSQVTDLTTDLAGKQDNVITTQGDLVIGDASGNPVRLPVGSADQVLTSDGTTVSFQDAAGGAGVPTEMTLITSTSPSTGATSTTISGLSGYNDYLILIEGIKTDTTRNLEITFNGQGGTAYSWAGYNQLNSGSVDRADNFGVSSIEMAQLNGENSNIWIRIHNASGGGLAGFEIGNVRPFGALRNLFGTVDLGGSAFSSITFDITNGTIDSIDNTRVYGA